MDQVTDQLWIANIRDVYRESTSQFDAVVTICQDSVEANVSCSYQHFPLSDGPPPEDAYNPGEFSYDLFSDAVDAIRDYLDDGCTTLVHCHAGKSRSATAIITVLAVETEMSFDEAFDHVSEARKGGIRPEQHLLDLGRRYVNE